MIKWEKEITAGMPAPRRAVLFAGLATAILSGGAAASSIEHTFSASAPSGHAAQVDITVEDSDNSVSIKMSNIMGSGYNAAESRALTGLFFDVSRDFNWTSVAVVEAGTGAVLGGDASESPIDYWAYRDDFSAGDSPFGTKYGLSAVGLGDEGYPGGFNHSHILGGSSSPPQPNGIDGGILSSTANEYIGNGQLPQWRTSIEFRFFMDNDFFADGLEGIEFYNVGFQFGSGYDEPSLTVIPAPAPVLMGGVGLVCLAAWRRRQSASKRQSNLN